MGFAFRAPPHLWGFMMAHGLFLPLVPCLLTLLPPLSPPPPHARQDCITQQSLTPAWFMVLRSAGPDLFFQWTIPPGAESGSSLWIFHQNVLSWFVFQSGIGTWSICLPSGLSAASIVAVTALFFLGQPPVFPSTMKWSFWLFQVGKGGAVERSHPPTPPRLVHTLWNLSPEYPWFPVF